MSKAFILIPEPPARRRGAAHPAPRSRGIWHRALWSLGEGAGQVVAQVLDAGCYRRAPHLSWLWRVITRRNSTPHEAPWRWLSLGGREQAPELWCLTPLSLENGHVLAERPELEEREFDGAHVRHRARLPEGGPSRSDLGHELVPDASRGLGRHHGARHGALRASCWTRRPSRAKPPKR